MFPFTRSSSKPTSSPKTSLQWHYQQHFGDIHAKEIKEEDVISCLEFDQQTGDYIGVGDGGGRVVLLERNPDSYGQLPEYQVFTEFQSHEPKFDTLKSEEISQQIKMIKWGPRVGDAHFLLTTNAKTIKAWKIYKKNVFSWDRSRKVNGSLGLPRSKEKKTILTHQQKEVYKNQHEFTINSISLNSDQETFLSADDLRINLWYLGRPEAKMTIVDIKPENMADLTEVITSSCFHPQECNTFLYTTTSGTIKLCDLRQNALCNNSSKEFFVKQIDRSFFSETIAAVSDAKFSPDGRYIVSRDYMSLKIWDVNMPKKPLKTLYVHESLRTKLYDLYENDCIFDKFDCNFSGCGNYVLTGSYKNYFNIFDIKGKKPFSAEASRKLKPKKEPNYTNADFFKKCLRTAWHPKENCTAIAAVNSLYIFTGQYK
uniref:Serine/threonine-protein phosphatase 2A 55 kDa regulatory subunit B n=1 Tax=Percolomonas cosmopolitus TaxID=63605 RepID=A0A7S1KQ97_9EUKA